MPLKSLVVDTCPPDAIQAIAINPGLEIVRKVWGREDGNTGPADMCSYRDIIPNIRDYHRVGFNVFYPIHMFNVYPFIRRNNIVKGTGPRLIAGGQGVGTNGALSDLVDEIVTGEIDTECADEILSDPILRGNKAVIEISRGCRGVCDFCEYSHTHRHRIKPIALVKAQIDEITSRRCRHINFMTTDFGGYPFIDELMEYALSRNVRVLNSDLCVSSVEKMRHGLPKMSAKIALGVESFDYETRRRLHKGFPDETLENAIRAILEYNSYIHFYMIFGLPGDNYEKWIEWLERIAKIRSTHHTEHALDLFGNQYRIDGKNIRLEFSITNFEPCQGTPLQDAPPVDFAKKDAFVRQWHEAHKRLGLVSAESFRYGGAGHIGRGEESYKILLMLKRGGPELASILKYVAINGISRSLRSQRLKGMLRRIEILQKDPNAVLPELLPGRKIDKKRSGHVQMNIFD
jgi:hypothetical protein